MGDTSGLVSISLLVCWVSFNFCLIEEGRLCNVRSNSLKRLLWNEKLKEISSFKILGRDSGSALVVSMVQ